MNNTTASNATSTTNDDDQGCMDVSCYFTTTEIVVITTIAFIVFFAGFVGNLLTAIVVILSKRFRSISNLSTLNLAFANLFLSIFVAPFNFVNTLIIDSWSFGLAFCKIFAFLRLASVVAILLNLLVVSIERFIAICFPFVLKMWKRLFIYAVPLVWLVACMFATPELIFYDLHSWWQGGGKYCFNVASGDWLEFLKIFSPVFLYSVLSFMVPLQIVTICILKVKGSAIKDTSHAHFVRRRNACYNLFLLMLTCLVCWLPLQISTSLFANNQVQDLKLVNILFVMFNLLFYVSTVVHPLIFFFLSPKGKRTLRAFLKKSKKRITSPETSKSNDSSRRRYWPFSGLSMRSSSMTKDTAV